ncbi:MAG: hypothetical protein P4L87_20850 [Formivibrio sp.]|nr:hypothetical protein [Formivibrio sp.]
MNEDIRLVNGPLLMTSKGKSVGRAYLAKKLQEKLGLSRRQAVLVLNVILDRMINALRRGWAVEFPSGSLKRVKRHFSKWWDSVEDTPANRNPYVIVHKLDEAGSRELNGWKRLEKGHGWGRTDRK